MQDLVVRKDSSEKIEIETLIFVIAAIHVQTSLLASNIIEGDTRDKIKSDGTKLRLRKFQLDIR